MAGVGDRHPVVPARGPPDDVDNDQPPTRQAVQQRHPQQGAGDGVGCTLNAGSVLVARSCGSPHPARARGGSVTGAFVIETLPSRCIGTIAFRSTEGNTVTESVRRCGRGAAVVPPSGSRPSPPSDPQPSPPGPRRRGEHARQRVLGAALEVLAESGMPGFTIESVARRAGASKATLYRHWPSASALLVDAMDAEFRPVPDVATGDVRADMINVLTAAAAMLDRSPFPELMAAFIDAAERDPALAGLQASLTQRRREPLLRVVLEAARQGALRGRRPRARRRPARRPVLLPPLRRPPADPRRTCPRRSSTTCSPPSDTGGRRSLTPSAGKGDTVAARLRCEIFPSDLDATTTRKKSRRRVQIFAGRAGRQHR